MENGRIELTDEQMQKLNKLLFKASVFEKIGNFVIIFSVLCVVAIIIITILK